jgi:hypothetical protein
VVATVVGGALVADCDRSWGRRGLTPVLLAVTVLGIYGTTPDTEHARVLAGVALPIALLGWPRPLASLGAAGSSVATALVSWTAVVDGLGRPGAVAGAIAGLGPHAPGHAVAAAGPGGHRRGRGRQRGAPGRGGRVAATPGCADRRRRRNRPLAVVAAASAAHRRGG